MEENKKQLTVTTTVNAPLEKVWDYWSKPEHIVKWSSASDDWHTPKADNNLRTGGGFSNRMEAKDGSMGFDFAGTYTEVRPQEYIEYVLGDERKVAITFSKENDAIKVVETFDAEEQNSLEMQQNGWQSIMNNFKKYTEAN